MLKRIFHRWERSLASVDNNRVVRPFEWGADWLSEQGRAPHGDPETYVRDYVERVMRDFGRVVRRRARIVLRHVAASLRRAPGERMITFQSAITTPHPENNMVTCATSCCARARRERRARPRRRRRGDGPVERRRGRHVGVCRMLAALGISAGAPEPALPRQAGCRRSSHGPTTSCRATSAHADGEPAGRARRPPGRRVAQAAGLRACRHPGHQPRLVPRAADDHPRAPGRRRGGSTTCRRGSATSSGRGYPRRTCAPDSTATSTCPCCVTRGARSVRSATCTRSAPPVAVHLRALRPVVPAAPLDDIVAESRRCGVPTTVRVLPCGHYTTGKAPFKFIDGYTWPRSCGATYSGVRSKTQRSSINRRTLCFRPDPASQIAEDALKAS